MIPRSSAGSLSMTSAQGWTAQPPACGATGALVVRCMPSGSRISRRESLFPRDATNRFHQRTEQGVTGVGVVMAMPGRMHLRPIAQHIRELRPQAAGRPLPPGGRRLGPQPRTVAEQLTDGRPAHTRTGKVLLQRIVEVDQPLVPQPQHQNGRERLGDRADPVLRTGIGSVPVDTRTRCSIPSVPAAPPQQRETAHARPAGRRRCGAGGRAGYWEAGLHREKSWSNPYPTGRPLTNPFPGKPRHAHSESRKESAARPRTGRHAPDRVVSSGSRPPVWAVRGCCPANSYTEHTC